jgi:hypothetical protein
MSGIATGQDDNIYHPPGQRRFDLVCTQSLLLGLLQAQGRWGVCFPRERNSA